MTSGHLDSLDSLLATLSGETWERLRDAAKLSVSFGEETITDLLALDINRKGLKTTTFEQISKPVEAYIGTDYEWWVGHDQIGWIRLAVQAKKLVLDRQQYNFRHANKSNIQQIDLLERYAKKVRALPLYCLYNYSNNVDSQGHWRCGLRPFEEKDLGCTVVPSRTIRRLGSVDIYIILGICQQLNYLQNNGHGCWSSFVVSQTCMSDRSPTVSGSSRPSSG